MSAEQDRAPVPSEVSLPNSEPAQDAMPPPARQPSESFWARMRRHKVVEWTLAYVAFGYALLHTVEMLGEAFEWPLLVPRLTVFGLVLGAPIAVTLAWYHGHRARHRVSGPELSILIVLLLVAGSVMWWLSRNSHEHRVTSAPTAVANTAPAPVPGAAAFNPPTHSIAVLPFVNMSGDKDQEYFSEGLTEELLNSLSRIKELQVAARTSSFSFQGEHPDIAAVAHKLNVGAVLEGSVRRSGHTLRVTTQLVSGITGFHVWSQTYDRDLGDVLKLQTEIATAVAEALKVTLLGDVPTKIEVGGTRNPAAYDAYLRSASAYWRVGSARDAQAVIAGYKEAVRLDPNFALAYAELSISLTAYAQTWAHGPAVSDFRVQARAPALKAVALAPELADGHLASFFVNNLSLDFARANEEIEMAMALAPGNARVLRNYAAFAAYMGHADAGIAAMRRAVALDPLNANSHGYLSDALRLARRYDEALAAYQNSVALAQNDPSFAVSGSLVYYALGDFEKMRVLCEGVKQSEIHDVQDCLALAYRKLDRQADAETALARLKALEGNGGAYGYARIYAQWGDTSKALQCLETALQLRDPQLRHMKAEPLLDPLRKEPRFQAIERELKFPD
jgi:TolB-like protein/Tfp pilus assembly protein PilF